MPDNKIVDKILKFYLEKNTQKPPLPIDFSPCSQAITFNNGIGDTTIINSLSFKDNGEFSNISIYSPSRHFSNILNFNPHKNKNSFIQGAEAVRTEVLENFDIGGGHLIQNIRRAFGLDEIIKPSARLYTGKTTKKNKVAVHLSTGPSAFELSNIKANPRQIYAHNIELIKQFIADNSHIYEFIEFGGDSLELGCSNFCGQNLDDSIEELSTCEYLIGLNSGFMNLAAALNIKSIIIVNVPESYDIVLPRLKDVKINDLNWLYPQNVHLHQDNETDLVPILSKNNLSKALNGGVYPYWSEQYLDITL
jgi:hypothetical protein